MQYVNVGAYSDNARIPTKKALKEMASSHPELLRFDRTSLLDTSGLPTLISIRHINDKSYSLSVVGPDPYNARNWYAQVTCKNGKVTVK